MKQMRRLGGALAALLLLAGCASVESRIQGNWSYFESLSPEAQELIRQGRIDIGFTPEMVRLALGLPDRVYSRQDESGRSETWAYLSYGGPYTDGFYRRRFYYDPFYSGFWDYPHEGRYPRLRVEFEGGRVEAIEERRR